MFFNKIKLKNKLIPSLKTSKTTSFINIDLIILALFFIFNCYLIPS